MSGFGPGVSNDPADYEWGSEYERVKTIVIGGSPSNQVVFDHYAGLLMYLFGMAYMAGKISVYEKHPSLGDEG